MNEESPENMLYTLRHVGAPLLLAAALTVGGCAPGGAGEPGPNAAAKAEAGLTLSGNYLAGRQAQAGRDMEGAVLFLKAALALDPDNPDLIRRAMLVLLMEGRIPEALPLAKRIPAGTNGTAAAALALAVDDVQQGRFQEAAARFDKGNGDEGGLTLIMGPLVRAWALQGAGQTEEALKALGKLGRGKGFKALQDLHAGLILDVAGRRDEAVPHLEAATKSDAGVSLRLAVLGGNLLERMGRPDEARELYDRYLAQRSESRMLAPALARLDGGTLPNPRVANAADGVAESLFGVASSFRQQNARETAMVMGRLALYLKPEFPVARILVGDILESEGRLARANDEYAAIPEASPFARSARLRIAANLAELDRADEAIESLRAMAAQDAADHEPLVDVGDILRKRERFAEAVAAYDAAMARIGAPRKSDWSLLYARGIALERSKVWDRAEADFLKALELEPDQPYVLNYLGYSWVEKGLHLDRAQDMIRKAVKLRPNDGYIVDSLGWVYFQLGQFAPAVRELERAVELRPQDPVINDHLGDAYWRVGRLNEAQFQWRRALNLAPEKAEIAKIRGKLEHGLKPLAGSGGG